MPSEVRSYYKIFLFSSSRLGEVRFTFYPEALRDRDGGHDASFDKFESDGKEIDE
jgi:hypothetical protein